MIIGLEVNALQYDPTSHHSVNPIKPSPRLKRQKPRYGRPGQPANPMNDRQIICVATYPRRRIISDRLSADLHLYKSYKRHFSGAGINKRIPPSARRSRISQWRGIKSHRIIKIAPTRNPEDPFQMANYKHGPVASRELAQEELAITASHRSRQEPRYLGGGAKSGGISSIVSTTRTRILNANMWRFIDVLLYFILITSANTTKDEEWEAARSNETQAANLMMRLINKSDSRIRPNIYGKPVDVSCDLYIASFGSINAENMDFHVDLFFRQRWTDPRYQFDEQDTPVIITPKLKDKIWVPDLFFPNEKSASVHEVMLPNEAIKIYPNGTVFYSSRLTLRLSCPMVLTHFPMDYQDCFIKISSYSYSEADVVLNWFDSEPVELNTDELFLPQFELLGTSSDTCETKYKTGRFSCLMAYIHLRRQYGYYLLQSYIPSVLIVIISWLSFWLHKEAVPARITLGVTTVLTMATQLQSAGGTIVSYARAIDIWYAFCMILVFSTLIQYAFVTSFSRAEEHRRRMRQRSEYEENDKADEMHELNPLHYSDVNTNSRASMRSKGSIRRTPEQEPSAPWCTADNLDKASRIIFPLSFILFNIVYWLMYSQKIIFTSETTRVGQTIK